jgi:hypothetical protein
VKEDEVPAAKQAAAAVDPQDGLFDNVIENDVLEKALERRQTAKEKVGTDRASYKKADEAAKALLPDIDPDQIVRCGRFRIRVIRRPARSVSFDTEEKLTTSISLIEE